MTSVGIAALGIHVCADIANAGPDRRWPTLHVTQDSAQRMERICRQLGVSEHRTLGGERATVAALLGALDDAAEVLADHGLLVLTFSGHTARGDGPIETARWCLFDAGVELSQIAARLARLPHEARLLIICDSCYAAAIAAALVGAQPAIVLAGCGEDQTTVDRLRSEFVVRLEEFVDARRADGSLAELRDLLAADTPDCERPVVWTNREDRWSRPLAPGAPGPCGDGIRA